MFGSSKKQVIRLSDQVETIIGKDTLFKGTITSQGTIRVDGQHEGELETTNDLVIGESGKLTSQVKARNATVAGAINGNLEIAEKLELLPTAKLFGDIKVGSLTINEGAIFRGNCLMNTASSIQNEE